MMHPYWGKDFVDFLITLFQRCTLLVSGQLSLYEYASDELQLGMLLLLCCSCSLLGPFLIYKKATMVANALSHTILLGMVVTFCLFSFYAGEGISQILSLRMLLIASIFTALITVFFIDILGEKFHLQKDASIAIVFTSFFALGILLLTLYFRNAHIGTEAIMGNIDAMHTQDLKIGLYLTLMNGAIFFLCFKNFFLASFDTTFAKSVGVWTKSLHYLFLLLIAMTAIGFFRVVGVVLFLNFLLLPPLIARLYVHRLTHQVLLSLGIGSSCSLFAVALTRHFLTIYGLALSTAGLLSMLMGGIYGIALLIEQIRKRKAHTLTERQAHGKL